MWIKKAASPLHLHSTYNYRLNQGDQSNEENPWYTIIPWQDWEPGTPRDYGIIPLALIASWFKPMYYYDSAFYPMLPLHNWIPWQSWDLNIPCGYPMSLFDFIISWFLRSSLNYRNQILTYNAMTVGLFTPLEHRIDWIRPLEMIASLFLQNPFYYRNHFYTNLTWNTLYSCYFWGSNTLSEYRFCPVFKDTSRFLLRRTNDASTTNYDNPFNQTLHLNRNQSWDCDFVKFQVGTLRNELLRLVQEWARIRWRSNQILWESQGTLPCHALPQSYPEYNPSLKANLINKEEEEIKNVTKISTDLLASQTLSNEATPGNLDQLSYQNILQNSISVLITDELLNISLSQNTTILENSLSSTEKSSTLAQSKASLRKPCSTAIISPFNKDLSLVKDQLQNKTSTSKNLPSVKNSRCNKGPNHCQELNTDVSMNKKLPSGTVRQEDLPSNQDSWDKRKLNSDTCTSYYRHSLSVFRSRTWINSNQRFNKNVSIDQLPLPNETLLTQKKKSANQDLQGKKEPNSRMKERYKSPPNESGTLKDNIRHMEKRADRRSKRNLTTRSKKVIQSYEGRKESKILNAESCKEYFKSTQLPRYLTKAESLAEQTKEEIKSPHSPKQLKQNKTFATMNKDTQSKLPSTDDVPLNNQDDKWNINTNIENREALMSAQNPNTATQSYPIPSQTEPPPQIFPLHSGPVVPGLMSNSNSSAWIQNSTQLSLQQYNQPMQCFLCRWSEWMSKMHQYLLWKHWFEHHGVQRQIQQQPYHQSPQWPPVAQDMTFNQVPPHSAIPNSLPSLQYINTTGK